MNQYIPNTDANDLIEEIDEAIAEAQATADECEELLDELEKTS